MSTQSSDHEEVEGKFFFGALSFKGKGRGGVKTLKNPILVATCAVSIVLVFGVFIIGFTHPEWIPGVLAFGRWTKWF